MSATAAATNEDVADVSELATDGRGTAQAPALRPKDPADAGVPSALPARLAAAVNNPSTLPLLIVVAAFIAVSVAALMWATTPNYQVLYSNLEPADGGSIIAELDARGVPYQISEGGRAIMVPAADVHTLRLQLAEQGLPEGGKAGFELLDNQGFGISQFAEQVNFQRGLEGELGRSVEALGPVAAARVHLAMAKPSVFVRDQEPTKASVVLKLHAGRTLSNGQVNAIVHMISSSVEKLTAENISVVDQRGELLSRPSSGAVELDGTQLTYTQEMEQSFQERVRNILTPILGPENFRVQVSADIDFSSVEETTEAYSPNQSGEQAAVRSSQSSSNFSGDEAVARGIPGALSNTAPNWAPSPIEEPGDEADETVEGDSAARANVQRDNIINYELDRRLRHVKHSLGGLERLSVAVVVNNRPATDDEGNQIFEAVPAAELEQITRLVQQAVGFSPERGDQVEVINSPFTETVVDEPEVQPWWQSPFAINTATSILRYLAAGLLILLGYRMIIRPIMARHLGIDFKGAARAETVALPGGGEMLIGDMRGSDDGSAAGAPGGDSQSFKRVDKSATYAEQLAELRRMGDEDPRLVAMIIRNWIKDDG